MHLKAEDLLDSESRIQACEQWKHSDSEPESCLSLSYQDFQIQSQDLPPLNIELKAISCQADWDCLFVLRQAIEVPYGLSDREQIQILISDTQAKVKQLQGLWYLANYQGQWVGAVGRVPFQNPSGQWGRLQDVDIIPAYQGRGLGRQLLQAICQQGFAAGDQAIGLKALQSGWPLKWYQRFGFKLLL